MVTPDKKPTLSGNKAVPSSSCFLTGGTFIQAYRGRVLKTKSCKAKVCSGCGQEKKVSEFRKNGKYLYSKCRGCVLLKQRKYVEEHPLKIKALRLFNNSKRRNGVLLGIKNNLSYRWVEREIEKLIGLPCKYCLSLLTLDSISLDHVISLSNGGDSLQENIQFICKSCNSAKGQFNDSFFTPLLAFADKYGQKKILLGKLKAAAFIFRKGKNEVN